MKRSNLIVGAAGIIAGLFVPSAKARSSMISLRVVAETASTITFGWDPVAGATGFRYTAEKQAKPSHTWDGSVTQVKFAKGSAWYKVEALGVQDQGSYPPVAPPPPPPPGNELAWGYRPALPDGWTLVEDQSLGTLAGKSNTMYRNCRGVWLGSAQPWNHDLIFVDCDLRGGAGKFGDRIKFYGCRFGERSDGDAIQTSGLNDKQSTDWVFQGCTIRDITTPTSLHPDGIEVYGLNGCTIRYCYFDNIAVETILVQPFQANNCQNQNVLIERNYFGPNRPTAGGSDVKIADTASSGNLDAHSRDNYGGSTAVYPLSAANGCTADPHHDRSEWPYKLLRADGWLDY